MNSVEVFDRSNSEISRLVYQRLKEKNLAVELEIYFDQIPVSRSSARRVLIQVEPPAVLPNLYTERAKRKFHQIITMSPWRAERLGEQAYCFQPVDRPTVTFNPSTVRSKSIAIINDHKFSAAKSARYSTRRLLISKLEKSDFELDLYGPNWNMKRALEFRKRMAAVSKFITAGRFPSIKEAFGQTFKTYSSYRGVAGSKLLVLSQYKFALVIENDIDSLTEKLFDAIFAGTIPLYLGPKLESYTDLHNFCIRLPDDVDLAFNAIQKNFNLEHHELIGRIIDFTRDPDSMTFVSPLDVAKVIATQISHKLYD